MDPLSNLAISPVILRLIASLDEFKGRWQAIGRLAPDRLSALRRVATDSAALKVIHRAGVKLIHGATV